MEINSDRQKKRKELKIENGKKIDENKYLHKEIQEIRSSRLISVPACLIQ